jgi:putative transposase
MRSAAERREAVTAITQRGISQRRACVLVHIHDSSLRYRARPRDHQPLVTRLQTIAGEHPRSGYRRAWAIIRREGQVVNHKRVARLWRQAGLGVPRRVRRKRRAGTTVRPCQVNRPNHVWTYDFLYDRSANGRTLKLLKVADEFTREGLAIEAATSITAAGVQRLLMRDERTPTSEEGLLQIIPPLIGRLHVLEALEPAQRPLHDSAMPPQPFARSQARNP